MTALFSPYTIRSIVFPNRVVMPPMVREMGDQDGRVSDELVEEYGRRADAGTGLIIVEATAVHPAGRCWEGGLCAYDEGHHAGLARLAARIRGSGSVAGIQLVHGGPQASPELAGVPLLGPSPVRAKQKYPPPRELSVDEILTIEGHFAAAAAMVAAAGFQYVEVHGAHGYLLDSFLAPKRNLRSDAYGGDMAGRMRMLVETCREVRKRVGHAVLLGCRVSIFNQPASAFSPAELHTLVSGIEDAGVDLIHVSTNGVFRGHFDPPRPLSLWVREMTPMPLIVAGGIRHPAQAERVIAEGLADFVAVGKGMLGRPDWTRYSRSRLEKDQGRSSAGEG